MSRSIRVILLDDREVVRVGLRAFFAATEVEVLAEGVTTDSLSSLYTAFRPDIVIAEIHLGGKSMFEFLDVLKEQHEEVKLVFFSAFDNPIYLARAAVLGADDYVLKIAPLTELLQVIRSIAFGTPLTHGNKLRNVTSAMRMRSVADNWDLPLTKREIQILRHLAQGLSNKEIARSLVLSVETIKEHVQNILRKTSLRDRTQAAVWAVRKRLI